MLPISSIQLQLLLRYFTLTVKGYLTVNGVSVDIIHFSNFLLFSLCKRVSKMEASTMISEIIMKTKMKTLTSNFES